MSTYELNRLLFELQAPDAREALRADGDAHLAGYDLTAQERALVEARDWTGLIDAGAVVYVLANLARASDMTFYELGAALRGESPAQMSEFIEQQSQRIAQFAIVPEETVNG